MRQTFSVPEVSCDHCKSTIEGALKPVGGVTDATVEVASKNVSVEYDPGVITEERLIGVIEEAGYDVAR